MAKHNTTSFQFPLPIDGATIEIPLTQGYVTIIDAVDADLVGFGWRASVSTANLIYVKRNQTLSASRDYLHRLILTRILGRALTKGEHVDHIDGDPLNNTRANLRLATGKQNNANTRRRSDNTSGYKGVSFISRLGKWGAYIYIDGRSTYLGLYASPEEAHEAYCVAAREHYGEFARFK